MHVVTSWLRQGIFLIFCFSEFVWNVVTYFWRKKQHLTRTFFSLVGMWKLFDNFTDWVNDHKVILNIMYDSMKKIKFKKLLLFLNDINLKRSYFKDNI